MDSELNRHNTTRKSLSEKQNKDNISANSPTDYNFLENLKNKRVLITGASKGLGVVCAQALASYGASLALIARSSEKLIKAKDSFKNPEKHICIPADLTDLDQLHESVKQSKEFLKDIDIVLHVVGGGLGLRDPLLSFNDLSKLFMLNLGIAAEINRIVCPDMIKKKKGNLVHVCSIASGEATGSVGYNTVKTALAGYVRTLGREMAGNGIVVTGLLPGGFYAPENSWRRLESKDPSVVSKFISERLPRKFMGKAEEIVPLVLFLCSDSASMMGGCLVPIDAGESRSYVI